MDPPHMFVIGQAGRQAATGGKVQRGFDASSGAEQYGERRVKPPIFWCLVQLWLEMPVTSMVKNLVILSYYINFDGVVSLVTSCNW